MPCIFISIAKMLFFIIVTLPNFAPLARMILSFASGGLLTSANCPTLTYNSLSQSPAKGQKMNSNVLKCPIWFFKSCRYHVCYKINRYTLLVDYACPLQLFLLTTFSNLKKSGLKIERSFSYKILMFHF